MPAWWNRNRFRARQTSDPGSAPSVEGAALLTPMLLILALALSFLLLTRQVHSGGFQDWDERILRALRRPDDSAVLVGPWWLGEVAEDLTALGSFAVVSLLLLAVIGYVLILRRYVIALFILLGASSGFLANEILKQFIGRERPTVVPHLQTVHSLSFPSGHAMTSAIVYLTLGVLLMQVLPSRGLRIYCLLCAMLLTFLVGVTRLLLGVHYPSDVLAGWIAGVAWALMWLLLLQFVHHRSARAKLKNPC